MLATGNDKHYPMADIEKTVVGIIHLRSDGEHLYLGTVHGRKGPDDPIANTLWKWDYWQQEK